MKSANTNVGNSLKFYLQLEVLLQLLEEESQLQRYLNKPQ